MKNIYLDNGATSFPKAPGVKEAIVNSLEGVSGNIGRTHSKKAIEAERIVFETREKLAQYFGYDNEENVVFTKNITESLNIIIKGSLCQGDHVLVSSLEHNSVIRPLEELKATLKITYDQIPCDEKGIMKYEMIDQMIKDNTKLIVVSHASNVFGMVNDIDKIGQIAKEKAIPLVVDAAQTAGILPIDMASMNISCVCFTGHKSLLGPSGIGGFVITDAFNETVRPFIVGGTGSKSESIHQPHFMPDKFESGTPNIIGIYGLHAALLYQETLEPYQAYEHEMTLLKAMIDGLQELVSKGDIKLVGIDDHENFYDNKEHLGVLSIDCLTEDNAYVAHRLNADFGIQTRVGLHCSPLAHKALNTFPKGTIRFSFSLFNTLEDVTYCVDSLYQVLNK